jgi:hypothetical protein
MAHRLGVVRIELETSIYKFPSIYTTLANQSTPLQAKTAYIEYQIVIDLYEVLTKIAHISFLVVLSQAGAFLFLWLYSIIGYLAGTI